jgi:A/G-specific adenine glycosylase
MPAEQAAHTAFNAVNFRRSLLRWFHHYQRKLPWRGERDPYRILVSEIMLQQTRVAVVEERYKRFIAQFPTAEKLARASEASVLAAWSGLGYYRRARNLRRAAAEIVRNGGFPRSSLALRELPGIGRYTANAVASIAFGEAVAVVDGNVKRVLERIFASAVAAQGKSSEERYWQFAGHLLATRNPGDFNQAIMELGALVCLPGKPLCGECPVARMCAAQGPVPRKQRATRRRAVLRYALARKQGTILLQQRPQQVSLMPGMWELPMIEPGTSVAEPLLKLRHSITTTDYTIFVYSARGLGAKSGKWVPARSIARLPLTGLARKVLARLGDA